MDLGAIICGQCISNPLPSSSIDFIQFSGVIIRQLNKVMWVHRQRKLITLRNYSGLVSWSTQIAGELSKILWSIGAHDYVLMAVGLINFAAPRVVHLPSPHVKFNIGLELHAEDFLFRPVWELDATAVEIFNASFDSKRCDK